jgi:UDP-N-acetylmuramoylalanine--D-glutamate ligase
MMNKKFDEYISKVKDKKILIQGLGLNGGGVGTALFFLENGIKLTITDLKNETELERSIKDLEYYSDKITYVLGRHREEDFKNADIVVKGPGVPPSNKFIQTARQNGVKITSDIDIFTEIAPCPLFALTGSKGKSSTVSAIFNIFKEKTANSFLGGNITISPLTFYKELDPESLVILELSSWQLRDIKGTGYNFKGAGITNLLNDHQNYYSNMLDYLADKAVITESQKNGDFLILPYKDRFLNPHNIKTGAEVYFISADDKNADLFFDRQTAYFKDEMLFDSKIIKIPGEHNKLNILFAAGFSKLCGIEKEIIIRGIENFKGTPYRLELVREWKGIKFINDTTATIPEAAANALKSFNEPIIWIAGGNDKNLDFSIIKNVADIPKKILLLKGEGTDKMKKVLNRNNLIESSSLEVLFKAALEMTESGDIILLSPGCTSFGLFQNEFHRGDVFNELVRKLE